MRQRKIRLFLYPLFIMVCGAVFFLLGGSVSGVIYYMVSRTAFWRGPAGMTESIYFGVGFLIFLPAGIIGTLLLDLVIRKKYPYEVSKVADVLLAVLFSLSLWGYGFMEGSALWLYFFWLSGGILYALALKQVWAGVIYMTVVAILTVVGLPITENALIVRFRNEQWEIYYRIVMPVLVSAVMGGAAGFGRGVVYGIFYDPSSHT
ncbi:hypothetical protein [Anaerobium acetethylicum]|uniref:Uncharacterized protein n=1 Tax=Anaerobium acetethylicum TaxID=1619234 RepID=A0A1D3TVI1_9FIRM|nr:hypothetical protein [Anaerobium acetethylicum]SCP98162.1 hypothetical protein SAMN05421730_101735 [Anaerobium acetethylicum]